MTESQFTQRLLKELRKTMPYAVVLKHNDRTTGGVPDFSITRFDAGAYSRTTWCEVKLTGSYGEMFRPLQLEMLKRLGGWYLIWSTEKRTGWLVRADEHETWSASEALDFKALVEQIRRFF